MAYPFLLNIPIPGLNVPESETQTTPSDQQALPHDTTEPQLGVASIFGNLQTHESPHINKEELEHTAVSSMTSPSGPPAPPDHQFGPSASPARNGPSNKLVFRNQRPAIATAASGQGIDRIYNPRIENVGDRGVIDLTELDDRSEDVGGRVVIDLTELDDDDDSSLSSSPSRVSEPRAVKEELGSTPEPGSPSETNISTGHTSLLDSTSPCAGSVPGLSQSVEPDCERPEPDGWSQPPGERSPRGTKRPADPEPDNQGTNADNLPQKKRGRAKKGPPPPIYKAAVAELPNDVSAIPGALNIHDKIIERIKKCLDRAQHEGGTTEKEAKAALHLAYKLMGQHNVRYAEVTSYKTPEEQAQTAGRSVVKIQRADEKQVRIPIRQFVADLANAMVVFFDCKSYSSSYRFRLEWVFYGIAQNTASAAVAFERIYNLIMDWARYKKGISATNSYCLGVSYGLYKDAQRERAEELERAKQAETEALAKREREEEHQRKEEIRRLQQPTVEDEPESEMHPQGPPMVSSEEPEPTRRHPIIIDLGDAPSDTSSDTSDTSSDTASESGDSDMADISDAIAIPDDDSDRGDDSDEYEADFRFDDEDDESQHFENIDDEIMHLAGKTYKRESPSPSPHTRAASPSPPLPTPGTPPRENTPEPEPQWKSAMQLMLFRQTAIKVAEDYLEKQGLKLGKRRAGATAKDPKAFNDGKKDSRKIDVHQKALKEKEDGDDGERDDEIL